MTVRERYKEGIKNNSLMKDLNCNACRDTKRKRAVEKGVGCSRVFDCMMKKVIKEKNEKK
jgi:hypothetical protein